MKKFLALALGLLLSFAFVTCGDDEEDLEFFIKFTATPDSAASVSASAGNGGVTGTFYAWGDNDNTYGQQTGTQPSLTLTLKAENSKNAAQSITIVIGPTDAAWVGTHANSDVALKLGAKTYTGKGSIKITSAPGGLFGGVYEGEFDNISVVAGEETLILTGGEINLERKS